jgi:NAD-dependent deacetylase
MRHSRLSFPGGVWERFRPLDFKTFMSSEEARREGLTRFLKIRDEVGPVTPGRGHKAAASWHAQGKLAGVITQNIDGLHQAAGVPVSKVVELHGNGTYAHCLSCGTRHELDWIAQQLDAHPGAPSCTACGGIVKTATISFGQPMPEDGMRRAERLTRECDLFLAVGHRWWWNRPPAFRCLPQGWAFRWSSSTAIRPRQMASLTLS